MRDSPRPARCLVFQHRGRTAEPGQGHRPHVSPAASSSPSQSISGFWNTSGKRREAHLADFRRSRRRFDALQTSDAQCALPRPARRLLLSVRRDECRRDADVRRLRPRPSREGRASRGRRCMSCNPTSRSTVTISRSAPTRRCGESCETSRHSAVANGEISSATWDLITGAGAARGAGGGRHPVHPAPRRRDGNPAGPAARQSGGRTDGRSDHVDRRNLLRAVQRRLHHRPFGSRTPCTRRTRGSIH